MSCYGGDDGSGDGGTSWGEVSDHHPPVLGYALHRLSLDMQQLREAMLGMNGKLEKMHDVVDLVTLGLRVHKQRVKRLEKKLKTVEWMVVACAEHGPTTPPARRGNRRRRALTCADSDGSGFSDMTDGLDMYLLDSDRADEASVQESTPPRSRSLRVAVPKSLDRRPKSRHAGAQSCPRVAPAILRGPGLDVRSAAEDRAPPPRPTPSPGVASHAVFRTCKFRSAPKSRASLGRRLLKAVEDGCVEDVLELLDLGADANFSAARRWVPLHRAARKANPDIVSMLLLWGANVHARTSYGFTALHIAAYNDLTGRCVTVLLEAASDVNSKNKSGRTPLHSAAECGNEAAVRVLLAAGARTNAKDDGGRTPYNVAKTDTVRRLLAPD